MKDCGAQAVVAPKALSPPTVVLEVGMLALKYTTASTQATFSVRRPRAVSPLLHLGQERRGEEEPLAGGSLGRLRGLERNMLRVDRCWRSPDGKGQERKKCWL